MYHDTISTIYYPPLFIIPTIVIPIHKNPCYNTAKNKGLINTMKSKKFESFDAAKEYMQSKGELKYWGRVGDNDLENGVYSLTIGVKMYHLFLRADGTVIVTDETYVSPT